MLRTRKPTNRPAWPLILLAGMDKAGKSWAAAEASKSPLVGRTYWITCGEDDPDELGLIGDFDIVEHDGSYTGILGAVRAVNAAEAEETQPSLIVLDSMSMVWLMLTDETQTIANQRAARRAAKVGKAAPVDDVSIGVDLWNKAAGKWRRLMDALRAHRGPVILTARLNFVTVMDGDQPTKDKEWKVEAHKSLPYDVTLTIQMRSRTDRVITGVRSVVYQTDPDTLTPFPVGRTVPDVWALLGIDKATDRSYRTPDGAASLAVETQVRADLLARAEKVCRDMGALDSWWMTHHGEPISEATDLAALLAVVEKGEETYAAALAEQAARAAEEPAAPAAAPAAPAAPAAASVADADRMRTLLSHLDRLGITSREERLFYAAALAGRPDLTSASDLTSAELESLATTLTSLPDREALETYLAQKEPSHA